MVNEGKQWIETSDVIPMFPSFLEHSVDATMSEKD